MKYTDRFLCLSCLVLCFSCKTFRSTYDPSKKYAPALLKKDYLLFRHILEDVHPSLYWYTSKAEMDHYFDEGYAQIRDSMDELQFRAHLSYVISRINCGHTSVRYSKKYSKYLDTARIRQFPLILKCWEDTMVVAANLNRDDSILKKGVVITRINGLPTPQIRDSLFHYVVTDGFSRTGKYQTLSTGFNFGNLYHSVFGLPDQFRIGYLDDHSIEKQVVIPDYDPLTDSSGQEKKRIERLKHLHEPGGKKHQRNERFATHGFRIDSSSHTAYMSLYTFSHGNHLRGFFHHSFKKLEQQHIPNLVIDVRSNGGGDANLSTLLTRYLIDKKFKLGDSLYAIRRHSRYDRYIEKSLLYDWLMLFVTHKEKDGFYHFGFFERHYFYPKKNHHFDGKVYILIGGNSFSATTLFAGALKGQSNVTLVGEETGGGAYGNTAWMIPDVVLPLTGIRFRLPKFRLVIDKNRPRDGRGILPDVPALPSVEAIRRGIDFKTEKAKELIRLQ